MRAVDQACDAAGLPARLLVLLRLHCSILNDCGFCVAMHSAEAQKLGLDVEALLSGSDFSSYSLAERATLQLAEVMCKISQTEGAIRALCSHFDEQQIVILCYAIAQINAWNRLARAGELTEGHFKNL
jgi:AhpD family alkylhydroperoxidase